MQNSKRTINLYQLLALCLALLVTVAIYFSNLSEFTYRQLSWLVVIDIVVCAMLFIVPKTAHLNNARFLFWLITSVFTFGQNIAHVMMDDQSPFINSLIYRRGYSRSLLLEGLVFTILAYNFFSIGLAVWTKKVGAKPKEPASLRDKKYAGTIMLTGSVLLAISIIPQLYYIYQEFQLFFLKGYGYSAADQIPGIFQVLHYWFVPALIMCYVGKAIQDKKPMFETVVLLAMAVSYLFVGDRGYALSIMLVLLWLRQIYHYGSKRSVYVAILVLLLMIPFVKFFRTAFAGSAEGAISDAFMEMQEVNPFLDLLMELGSTQEIIFMTIKRVGTEGLAYGKAYLDFFIKMFPSFLGLQMSYGNLAQWVIGTNSYQTRGFSVWGEAYLNCGKLGSVAMFFFGKLFGTLLGATEEDSPLKVILTASTLYFFADVSRRYISSFGFSFLYNIILPVFAAHFLYIWLKGRNQ